VEHGHEPLIVVRMNTNTGQLYPSVDAAIADLGPTETSADVVEVRGSLEAIERLSRDVQHARELERRRAANKVARKTRQQNRAK
jgi:hypothetical protein